MLSESARAELERQAYRIVGSHSAVKTCGWTKKMIRSGKGCYKLKFYGIMSHQCMQMTTSMSCANRCTFCWRGYKAPVSKEWMWDIDDPRLILEGSLAAHKQLLVGYKGNEQASKVLYEQSTNIQHVALSLTGEPITYPRLNELIDLFHAQGISTFLVTNATYPDQIKALKPITQLYLSIDAPNKPLLKQVDVPLFTDYWERMHASLDHLARKPERTCIRLTIIKGVNDVEPENYASLITKGNPDFLEVKGYMHVGASQKRLQRENMPEHAEIVAFSKQLLAHLPDYEMVSDHEPSRVVMFAKKRFKIDGEWRTWIDFPKFAELAQRGEPFTARDYLKPTPAVGIGALDEREVDEHTDERSFWINVSAEEDELL